MTKYVFVYRGMIFITIVISYIFLMKTISGTFIHCHLECIFELKTENYSNKS